MIKPARKEDAVVGFASGEEGEVLVVLGRSDRASRRFFALPIFPIFKQYQNVDDSPYSRARGEDAFPPEGINFGLIYAFGL